MADEASDDPNVGGVRSLFEAMAAHPGWYRSALQTVGAKGYDGFAIAIVEDTPAAS